MSNSPLHLNAHTQSQMDVSDAVLRRRSADVGGLHLAMRYQSQGQGWLDSTSSDTIIECALFFSFNFAFWKDFNFNFVYPSIPIYRQDRVCRVTYNNVS